MVLEGTDRELIHACQRGAAGAFHELFETYKDRVYSVALRYTGDEASAMDIAQDTFIKLFSSIGDFRGDARFETWVYRIVVNRCLDRRRRERRWLPLAGELVSQLRSKADALGDILRREKNGAVRRAIDRLTPEMRMVIVLRYTEELSYAEMAEVLGCSAGTVASRLSRAHKALEQRLAKMDEEKSNG